MKMIKLWLEAQMVNGVALTSLALKLVVMVSIQELTEKS